MQLEIDKKINDVISYMTNRLTQLGEEKEELMKYQKLDRERRILEYRLMSSEVPSITIYVVIIVIVIVIVEFLFVVRLQILVIVVVAFFNIRNREKTREKTRKKQLDTKTLKKINITQNSFYSIFFVLIFIFILFFNLSFFRCYVVLLFYRFIVLLDSHSFPLSSHAICYRYSF